MQGLRLLQDGIDAPEGIEEEQTLSGASVTELVEHLLSKRLDEDTVKELQENETKMDNFRLEAAAKNARLEADGKMHRIHRLGKDLSMVGMLWEQENFSNNFKVDPRIEHWEEQNECELTMMNLKLEDFSIDGLLRFFKQNPKITQNNDLSDTSQVCDCLQTFDVMSGVKAHWTMPIQHLVSNIVRDQTPGHLNKVDMKEQWRVTRNRHIQMIFEVMECTKKYERFLMAKLASEEEGMTASAIRIERVKILMNTTMLWSQFPFLNTAMRDSWSSMAAQIAHRCQNENRLKMYLSTRHPSNQTSEVAQSVATVSTAIQEMSHM